MDRIFKQDKVVRNDKDPALIRLEERRKGFQWSFSFDLMFMYESEGFIKADDTCFSI